MSQKSLVAVNACVFTQLYTHPLILQSHCVQDDTTNVAVFYGFAARVVFRLCRQHCAEILLSKLCGGVAHRLVLRLCPHSEVVASE